jgi:hypothetical protein
MGGRIDIETDDVAQLAHKLRVGGEFEPCLSGCLPKR